MSEVKNILDLPEEILREIIRQVPRDKLTVQTLTKTCKTFHKISCDVFFCELRLEVDRTYQNLLIDSLWGRRRCDRLVIVGKYKSLLSQADQLMKIVERFGRDIKYLTVEDLTLDETFADLLNLMPKLKTISIYDVDYYKDNAESKSKVNLQKLEEIYAKFQNDHSVLILNLFKNLPRGVLRKLTILNRNNSRENALSNEVKFFPNQYNIEDLEIFGHINAANLDFEKMKLKSLLLHEKISTNVVKILKGQRQITKLNLENQMKAGELRTICNELPCLEELTLSNAKKFDVNEFADLSKFKRLKKLTLHFEYNFETGDEENFNERIALLQSDGLECLDLGLSPSLTALSLNNLAAGLPRLKNFHKYGPRYKNELSVFLRNFPNLDSLTYCYYFSFSKTSGKAAFLEMLNETDLNACVEYFKFYEISKLDLSFDSLSEPEVAKLAACFPQLKILRVQILSSDLPFGSVIHHFPKLKSLEVEAEVFSCSHEIGMENNSLKKLSIKRTELNEDFVPIITSCKQLEELTIEGPVEINRLIYRILVDQPNLKIGFFDPEEF